MTVISSDIVLEEVEHILATGSGVLDSPVVGEDEYDTWWGTEDADWEVQNVDRVENGDEDRFLIYPDGETFHCENSAEGEESNPGPVRCWSE